MSGGARIWKVSYHRGALSALVKAETEERAVEIAKAHREKKPAFGGKPPKAVREDCYETTLASERDIAWARSFGVGVLTDMPEKPQKGAARSRKQPAGASPRGRGRNTPQRPIRRSGVMVGESYPSPRVRARRRT